MIQFYTLMRGDTNLGVLTPYEYDFPWTYCHFAATPDFLEIQPCFDREEQLLLAEEDARQAGGIISDAWEAAYASIEALQLRLVGDEGTVITSMLLHIYDGEAWFRS